jgi:hypothetical protein
MIPLLIQALQNQLGAANMGHLVYIRCFERAEITNLLAATHGRLGLWNIQGVGEEPGAGWITGDRAVEIREDKGEATLLLVDAARAGAGMDGIYNAARPLGEDAVFADAIKFAIKQMPTDLRSFAQEAVRRAKGVGGQRRAVPERQKLAFFAALLDNQDHPGAAMPKLGLWPVAGNAVTAEQALPHSALMVEKLLLPPATNLSAALRVQGLSLTCGASELEENLRQESGKPLLEALESITSVDVLWLGSLAPGFVEGVLKEIQVLPWRGQSGRLFSWSGLKEEAATGDEEASLPQFQVHDECALTVKWKVLPDDLPPGSATFEVRILAGDGVVATEEVVHRGKAELKATFTADHFEELDKGTRQEVRIEVSAAGSLDVEPKSTEDFLLCFGESSPRDTESNGEIFRCVADGLVQADTREEVIAFLEQRQQGKQGMPDKAKTASASKTQNLVFRLNRTRRGFRVERPTILRQIEDAWAKKADTPVGRWRVSCRPDGSQVGEPEFISLPQGECTEPEWVKLNDATRRFRDDCMKSGGVLSRFYLDGHVSAKATTDYLNAWLNAMSSGSTALATANTLEVTTLSGQHVGLVVLPMHAQRLAWQCAYDTLALNLKMEEKLPVKRLRSTLAWLDGANVPFALPGIVSGQSFLFADTVGFAGALMVAADDVEPKAAAALLATCYTGDASRLTPALNIGAGDAIAREVRHYLDTHDQCTLLQVHALHPGDGATVVRALGKALQLSENAQEEATDNEASLRPVAVRLDLHPTDKQSDVAGRHLTKLNERRRKGSAAPAKEDAWCLESLPLGGNRTIPRLRWARRDASGPQTAAHLALAFDVYQSTLATRVETPKLPLLAYGLVPHLVREFRFENGQPRWRLWLPREHDGLKLEPRFVTERLINLQTAVLKQTATHLGDETGWPELLTAPTEGNVETLAKLHQLCDWVVTMDRNAGIEFYDSPLDAASTFDAYVIDAVPERDDLGCQQLITSTMHFDEVRSILNHTLNSMGLSASARNCQVLLTHLKGLSGRLAMRLAASAGRAATGHELVGLALVRAKCLAASVGDECWLDMKRGFFVPLDDVRDLVPLAEPDEDGNETPNTRADLLYIGIPRARGHFSMRFVEVKYRSHLSGARSPDLGETIATQTRSTRKRWHDSFFSETATVTERTLRGARLARVLRFYADKAARHHLDAEAHKRFGETLAEFLRKPADYVLADLEAADVGFVFCPDFTAARPERLFRNDDQGCNIWLFGPDSLPDQTQPSGEIEAPPMLPVQPPPAEPAASIVTDDAPPQASPLVELPTTGVHLGETRADESVTWSPTIKTNPHLMIVGLPGMGKTHSLINICSQLQHRGITPIVFSYHDDIDDKLTEIFPLIQGYDCTTLGFNPLRIGQPSPIAHVESAGQIRDIFHAVFPDLGELQLEDLRSELKRSYEEKGWRNGATGETPLFRRFVDLLRERGGTDKRTQTLLARLNELDDFRFFDVSESSGGLLESGEPQIIRIHSVSNEAMQRACAGFVLYRIYQDMFRRGRQDRLTHAIVFDEAHRAGKLKLLPTMAKECRKYGIALIVASQEARDFDPGLFAAIGSNLVLRVTDQDARVMARNSAGSDQEKALADKLKTMPKYEAMFFTESLKKPVQVRLADRK